MRIQAIENHRAGLSRTKRPIPVTMDEAGDGEPSAKKQIHRGVDRARQFRWQRAAARQLGAVGLQTRREIYRSTPLLRDKETGNWIRGPSPRVFFCARWSREQQQPASHSPSGILAYSPLGSDHVAEGAVAGFISAIVGGTVAALFRRSSFVSTIPTNPNALIQATLLGNLLAAFNANTALLVFPICAALAGFWQIVIGRTGLARILKFAPYPVIAGFVSGVGFLIVLSQLPLFVPNLSLHGVANLKIDSSLLSACCLAFFLLRQCCSLCVGNRESPHC